MTRMELRRWRTKRGYSQVVLAKKLGVTSDTISRWERGTRTINKFLPAKLREVKP
jgi:transcriptional regulator with XRE-family HTH domain